MLKALRGLFAASTGEPLPAPGADWRPVQVAVATLLYEACRADYAEGDDEHAVAMAALADLFGLAQPECAALLKEGRVNAGKLRSFYRPVSAIKRAFELQERVRLIEHLWQVAFADGRLDPYEDHYVRKIAHLLYVPNTQSMLARNRARAAAPRG